MTAAPDKSAAPSVEQIVRDALVAVDAFIGRVNAHDVSGMEATLHFPHIIVAEEKLVILEKAGMLAPTYFADMTANTGWHHNTYLARKPVLVNLHKVHFLVDFTRHRADNTVISRQQGLWIATSQQGRWGLLLRST